VSSVDKISVRKEVDRIKDEFEQLGAAGKVSHECKLLIHSIFMIIDLILSIFLEKKTQKNSKNSSKPSSQTDKDESSITQSRTQSETEKKNSKTADNTRSVETITFVEVNQCDVCSEDLSDVDCQNVERRTKIDILFEKVIQHVDVETKLCPTCDSQVKGPFPKDMTASFQYGNGLKAFVINLLICQMVALKRTQHLVKSMLGELLSAATILKFVLRLHLALEIWEADSKTALLTQPAMHSDETSLRVDKKNYWIHVYSSGDITLKMLHRKRGTEAIEDIGIIPQYTGNIIHDSWASYLSYKHCGHGLCGSHLLRELTFIIESNGYAFAKNMKRLLQETCKKVSTSKDKKLDHRDYLNLQKRYRNILTRGSKELPSIAPKPDGKRGKLAKSDAHNLWERLKIHEPAVLLFAKVPEVAFTNNRAEQDLRMAKVKQKVSGCFRTEIYAKAYCRISSYVQTMSNKGIDPLAAIHLALNGNINNKEG
jgi:transposase